MNLMIWVWLGAIVVFGVAELMTEGMVSVWFVAGAIAALVASMLSAPVGIQVLTFVIASAIALAASRPLVRKLMNKPGIPVNLDRVIGAVARVTENIDNERASGAVYVDGKTWTARSEDGTVIPKGELVEIAGMEGIKLIVRAKAAVPAG